MKNKILIVDDDPVNIEIMSDILGDSYLIKIAETGSQALEVLPLFMPDVILLDIMMPGIDGYEVCRQIRANDEYKYIKVLLVSAKAMVQERLLGYDAGADDYLTKPFDHNEMLAKVKIFIKLKYKEEVDKLKSDLLHLLSHEKRTPLNAILGLSELLLSTSNNLNEEERSYVEEIFHAGQVLLDHAEKTMFLCQLKKGIALHKNLIDCKGVLEDIMKSLSGELTKKKISCRIKSDEFNFYGDPEQVAMLLKVLVENAINHSPENEEIVLSNYKKGDDCIFEISDSGKGFSEYALQNAFTEFGEENIMHHSKGLGIGLNLALHIVQNHNGTIQLMNGNETGARVIVNIPIAIGE